MSERKRLRVAIVGTGRRAAYMYEPIVRGLAADVELVAVWGRSEGSAQRLGVELGVPWYTDLEALIRAQEPDLGIVCVKHAANGEAGLMAVQSGLNVLLERPIAPSLAEADAIIAEARRRKIRVEVSEQFHRRPMEQLKLALIASGLLGRVYSAFNDFAGHGYHGVSVLRSYVGFDAVPVRVTGMVGRYELAPALSVISGATEARTETQEHGLIEFAGGEIGVFHWTSVGYDSPLRWWRSSRILAERGMAVTVGVGIDGEERISLLAPDGAAPAFLTVERIRERCDGGGLVSVRVHTPEGPIVWENPFPAGLQWHDDEIGVAGCLMSLVRAVREDGEPTYGAAQARLDQELILAIRASAEQGGGAVTLPLKADG